jgi:N6-L-threonylcarbamoyladenine synthase
MKAVLGIDTSCYTTSVAAVGMGGEMLASCRAPLEVPERSRGLQQSQAGFFHIRALPGLTRRLRAQLPGLEICAVCASARPRDALDSYMPVFVVGESQARVSAALLGVPFYATDHQAGHLRAALVDVDWPADCDALALHLSGGTTELLLRRGGRIERIGGSADLSAGQLVDRVGVALGLPFPSGPALEALALRGQAEQRLGVSLEDRAGAPLRCHLSGAEAQAMRWVRQGLRPEDIAAEVYALLARTIARLIALGAERAGVRRALLAGGVAGSALLRALLEERLARRGPAIELCFARPELAGDNAVGVALIGLDRWREETAQIKENGG